MHMAPMEHAVTDMWLCPPPIPSPPPPSFLALARKQKTVAGYIEICSDQGEAAVRCWSDAGAERAGRSRAEGTAGLLHEAPRAREDSAPHTACASLSSLARTGLALVEGASTRLARRGACLAVRLGGGQRNMHASAPEVIYC